MENVRSSPEQTTAPFEHNDGRSVHLPGDTVDEVTAVGIDRCTGTLDKAGTRLLTGVDDGDAGPASDRNSAESRRVNPGPEAVPSTPSSARGKWTSSPSTVMHSPGPRTFATNRGGRCDGLSDYTGEGPDNLRYGALEDPVTMICARFMYISRLPILLNYVHASKAGPAGASDGIVNE